MTVPFSSLSKISLTKIRWWIFVVAGFLLVSFVVLMGGLRLALPYLSDYEKDIEQYLGQELQRQVLVGKIDADWRWLSPRLKLEDVSIKNKDGRSQLVRFNEISFEFGVFHNLFNLSFEPTIITLSGANVIAKRDSKGRFYLQSVPVSIDLDKASEDETDFSRQLLAQLTNREIRLEDLRVSWTDEVYSKQLHVFDKVNSIFKVDESQYQLLVDIQAPAKMAKAILLKAEIERQADENERRSSFFLKAEKLNSLAVKNYLSDIGVGVDTVADAEIWLSAKGSDLESLSGSFSSPRLKLNSIGKRHKVNWVAKELNTRFKLQLKNNDWRLVFDDLNMQLNQSHWKDVYFSLRFNPEKKSLDLRCDYLSLDDLAELTMTMPIAESVKETISLYRPSGVLQKTNLVIENWTSVKNWLFNTEFSSLGLNLEEQNIRLAGLDGVLVLDKEKGKLNVDSEKVGFTSEYFNQPLIISSIQADIGLSKKEQAYVIESEKISAVIDQVTLDARLKYRHAENNHLDLQIESVAASADWVNRHKTDFFFSRGVVEWLNDALVTADFNNIKLAYHGALDAFPFTANEGVFQSSFDFSNGTLKYQPDWPAIQQLNGHFSIDQDNISITESSGYIYNSKIKTATTNINLSGSSHVKVNGVVASDSKELDRFFRHTPLKQSYIELVEPIELTTEFETILNIDVPLSEGDVRVSGEASVDDARLVVKYPRYEISQIKGMVKFNDTVVSSEKLDGVFNGMPVSASINTRPFKGSDKTIVSAQFSSGMDALLPFDLQLSHLYKKAGSWKLNVEVLHDAVELEPDLLVALKSDLSNMRLLLPEPLNKPAGQVVDFNFYFKDFKNSAELVVLCDEKINMHLRWNEDADSLWSDIRLQAGKPLQLKPGVNIAANIDNVDIKQWQELLEPFVSDQKQSDATVSFFNIQLSTDHLQYQDISLKSANINAIHKDEQWHIGIDAEHLKADARFSNELSKDRPLYLDFEKLDLSSLLVEKEDEATATTTTIFSPVDLPPLKISGKNFTFQDYFFDQLKAETSRSRYGMTIHALDLKSKNLSVKMKGNWFKRQGHDHSSFRVEMNSNNVGAMLSAYKFTESMRQGEGKAVIDWQWSASPFGFDWNLVSGNMQLDISEGEFVDIEPGAGRLLGMFSLSSLPKRFMLDFSDTFTEGFEFNQLSSKANFVDGSLYTSKTEIDGTAADIYFNGRIGLENKDYDATMSVIPRISSGVSGWIAVLQGAAVGLTAYIGQKILGVDEAAKNQYHITGSWSDPKIKKIKSDDEEEQNTQPAQDESEE